MKQFNMFYKVGLARISLLLLYTVSLDQRGYTKGEEGNHYVGVINRVSMNPIVV